MFDSAAHREMPTLPVLWEKLGEQCAMQLGTPVYDVPQYSHKPVQASLLLHVQVGLVAYSEAKVDGEHADHWECQKVGHADVVESGNGELLQVYIASKDRDEHAQGHWNDVKNVRILWLQMNWEKTKAAILQVMLMWAMARLTMRIRESPITQAVLERPTLVEANLCKRRVRGRALGVGVSAGYYIYDNSY